MKRRPASNKKKVAVKLRDGVVRHFSILLSKPDALLCEFPNGHWCVWTKESDRFWYVTVHSDDRDKNVGKPCAKFFVGVLDTIYEELAMNSLEDLLIGRDEHE